MKFVQPNAVHTVVSMRGSDDRPVLQCMSMPRTMKFSEAMRNLIEIPIRC